MIGFTTNIEDATLKNNNFRQVLYTGSYLQVVVMSLEAGEEIGEETHEAVDQFFRIEQGNAKFIVGEVETTVEEDGIFVVPAGSLHNVINVGERQLKLYTIYAPPNHPDGTTHLTKADADKYEAEVHHS